MIAGRHLFCAAGDVFRFAQLLTLEHVGPHVALDGGPEAWREGFSMILRGFPERL